MTPDFFLFFYGSVIVILFSQNAKKPHAGIISVKLAKFDKGEKSDHTSVRGDYKCERERFLFVLRHTEAKKRGRTLRGRLRSEEKNDA